MTVIEKQTSINIDDWQLSTNGEKLFSADAVIDAYLKGKSDQLEQSQKALMKQLETNIQKASGNTVKVLEYLSSQGLSPIAAHLKPTSFDSMEVLITLPEEDYLSEKITTIYEHVSTLEEAFSEELYQINFSLTDETPHFNEALLKCDGYFWKKEVSGKPVRQKKAVS
jgi:hypothetical protein